MTTLSTLLSAFGIWKVPSSADGRMISISKSLVLVYGASPLSGRRFSTDWSAGRLLMVTASEGMNDGEDMPSTFAHGVVVEGVGRVVPVVVDTGGRSVVVREGVDVCAVVVETGVTSSAIICNRK